MSTPRDRYHTVITAAVFTVPERDRLLATIHRLAGWEKDVQIELRVSDEGVAAWAAIEKSAQAG